MYFSRAKNLHRQLLSRRGGKVCPVDIPLRRQAGLVKAVKHKSTAKIKLRRTPRRKENSFARNRYEKCKYFGGTVALGYKIDSEKNYIIDEETAPIVKQMFQTLAGGYNYAQIARYLNGRGIKTARGGVWNKHSFHCLFSNRKYIGKYTFQGTEIEGGVPRIIDDELFDEVQRVLARYAAAPSRGKAKVEYILS